MYCPPGILILPRAVDACRHAHASTQQHGSTRHEQQQLASSGPDTHHRRAARSWGAHGAHRLHSPKAIGLNALNGQEAVAIDPRRPPALAAAAAADAASEAEQTEREEKAANDHDAGKGCGREARRESRAEHR